MVTGVKGRPPGPNYKVNATWDDGIIASLGLFMRGEGAARKVRLMADSILKRLDKMLRERNQPSLRRSLVEVIGDEASYGRHAQGHASREVFCRLTIEAEDASVFALLTREGNLGSVSMAPGIAGSSMVVSPRPIARLEQFFIPVEEVPARVTIGDRTETVERRRDLGTSPTPAISDPPTPELPADRKVPLARLAWARSGDKGNFCNIGITARRPEFLPYIAAALDNETIADHYASILEADSTIERYYLPGPNALNFVLGGALDGGCTQSLRFDPFGKAAAQDALAIPIAIPASLLD
jgi:hypothetical protein